MTNQTNVLWIICDQLSRHALSCYGNPNVKTPNIDRLAGEGVLCHTAVSQCPVCIPFRAGLFTGQYCHINNVRVHGDMLNPNSQTIANSFKNTGYKTSYVGKWHLASTVSDQFSGEEHWVHPLMRGGFEDWFGFDVSNSYYNTHYSTGFFCDRFKVEGHQTDGLTDISLKYLDSIKGDTNPWFHVISLEAPHSGYGNGTQMFSDYPAEPKYEKRFNAKNIALRDNVPQEAQQEARIKACGYYAMIEQIDYNVGRILNWLEKSGQSDNTLVAFFSDHGDMLGSHGRYQKQVAYDESIGIPLIMRLPGVIPAGRHHKGVVSGIDIFPVSAGLCNVRIPEKVQGIDLSAAICGISGNQRDEALIQWMGQSRYHWGNHPYRAIRTERYTYCVGVDKDDKTSEGYINLLFDNVADPYQLNNLFDSAQDYDLKKSLHARLKWAIKVSGEELPYFIK